MSQLMPYMTDEEIVMELYEYDEQGFSDMPSWLRHELQARSLTFPCRPPTNQEQLETEQDGRDHRKSHNEQTVDDFKHKYIHKGK